MKYCQKCNKEFPKGDQFCDSCGTKLSLKKGVITSNKKDYTKQEDNLKRINVSFILGLSSILGLLFTKLCVYTFSSNFGFLVWVFTFAFIIPTIPIISLVHNISSLRLIIKNNLLSEKWKIIGGIVLSSISILMGVYLFLHLWFEIF